MSQDNTTEQRWDIGTTQQLDWLGICARRTPWRPRDAIRAYWRWNADGAEIAARLRELADAIEGHDHD
jgi:hypothetical protein